MIRRVTNVLLMVLLVLTGGLPADCGAMVGLAGRPADSRKEAEAIVFSGGTSVQEYALTTGQPANITATPVDRVQAEWSVSIQPRVWFLRSGVYLNYHRDSPRWEQDRYAQFEYQRACPEWTGRGCGRRGNFH